MRMRIQSILHKLAWHKSTLCLSQHFSKSTKNPLPCIILYNFGHVSQHFSKSTPFLWTYWCRHYLIITAFLLELYLHYLDIVSYSGAPNKGMLMRGVAGKFCFACYERCMQ